MFEEIIIWEQQRLGKFTSSEIWKLMKPGRAKGEYFGQGAITYIKSRVAELATGERSPDVSSNAIEYGRALEPMAFAAFASAHPELEPLHYGVAVPKFFPFGDFAGGSPDGETINDGIIEIKCPYNSTNHIEHLLLDNQEDLLDLCPEYYWQIQANLLFTERSVAYFISYDPRVVKEESRLKVIEITPNAENQKEIEERIIKAAELMSDLFKKLNY